VDLVSKSFRVNHIHVTVNHVLPANIVNMVSARV